MTVKDNNKTDTKASPSTAHAGLGRIAPYDKHAAAGERNAKHQADMEAASAAADQRKTRAVEALRNAEITPKSCP